MALDPARSGAEPPRPAANGEARRGDGRARKKAARILAQADIEIGGDRPWDIQVHDERLWHRALTQGSLGLGEAYMEGWWDCERLDMFFHRLLSSDLRKAVHLSAPELATALKSRLFNRQSRRKADEVARRHYDIDRALFESMLDERMVYSCAYWKDVEDLDAAQEAKLRLSCEKLGLKPGMRVLDIGCGWGSLATFAAERFDVEVVGVTISHEQAVAARERCAGLPVEIRETDYREMPEETFDRVVSIGMFEHVGPKNHRTFFKVAHRHLAPGGLLLLHTIAQSKRVRAPDPWIERHIFPNGHLPTLGQIARAAEGRFVVEDVHNIGAHYDRTLMAWNERFQLGWPDLSMSKDGTFKRMWEYYLLSSAGGFRARTLQCYQVVLARDRGIEGGIVPVR
ncbi:MAG: cyclopropane fatty acyl phospholipid synthase [Euryarchaeota archaeon]|nr:cyclopropane fatty acyl phospholipid synthase [Euryarchaeota archaeon]